VAKVYADVHVPFAVVNCLRSLGADVLLVQDDEWRTESDPLLLWRATDLRRLLLTCDEDFVVIGGQWQAEGRRFPGVAFVKSNDVDPRSVAESVMILLTCGEPTEVEDQVHYVPF